MLDRRTCYEFLFCAVVGPTLVLIGIALDRVLGGGLGLLSGSLLIDGAVNLLIILSIVTGSSLTILGALKVTEWVHMPAQRRHHVRAVPVLTTAWAIALAETAMLMTFVMMWMTWI